MFSLSIEYKNQLDDSTLYEVDFRILTYNDNHEKYNDIVNEAQRAFDIHRINFPEDFNFELFLTNDYPGYQQALFERNTSRNKLNNILRDLFQRDFEI